MNTKRMLKYEQTVNIQVNPRKNAFFRIFCELPAKIGSIIRIKQGHLRGYSRNECCPCEGIDTYIKRDCFKMRSEVEMSVARVRALTRPTTLRQSSGLRVEMSVARVRALTPNTGLPVLLVLNR